MFRIETCQASDNCPRAVRETKKIIEEIENIFIKTNFTEKRKKIFKGKIMQHHLFKVCLAGCPNGCSKPHIKDFSLVAYAEPVINRELCTLCGACWKKCKEEALKIEEGVLTLDEDKCLGCGDCWQVCSQKAITKGEEKWRVLRGGKLGRHPQFAKEIALVSDEKALDYLEKTIEIILKNDEPKKRIADLFKSELSY